MSEAAPKAEEFLSFLDDLKESLRCTRTGRIRYVHNPSHIRPYRLQEQWSILEDEGDRTEWRDVPCVTETDPG